MVFTNSLIPSIAKAIAAYERTLLSTNSPFDRFMAGDAKAISDAQKRGWELIKGKAQCITCHTFKPESPLFTNFKFHNTGIATKEQNFAELVRQAEQLMTSSGDRAQALAKLSHLDGFSELGRFNVTRQPRDIGAFKTPALRDVELTARYMHNGSIKTLLDVVKFYNQGGEPNSYLDREMRPLNLNDAEMNELVEFMRALTSDDVRRLAQSTKPQTRAPMPLPEVEATATP